MYITNIKFISNVYNEYKTQTWVSGSTPPSKGWPASTSSSSSPVQVLVCKSSRRRNHLPAAYIVFRKTQLCHLSPFQDKIWQLLLTNYSLHNWSIVKGGRWQKRPGFAYLPQSWNLFHLPEYLYLYLYLYLYSPEYLFHLPPLLPPLLPPPPLPPFPSTTAANRTAATNTISPKLLMFNILPVCSVLHQPIYRFLI